MRCIKYNIALVPKNPQLFIDYAHHTVYAANKNTYLIGDGSIPHITLCHFNAEPDAIDGIWQTVCAQQLNTTQLTICFAFMRSSYYPNYHPEAGAWIFLIPDHSATLHTLHRKVAKIIQHPTNFAWENYDPHLTLLNNKIDFSLCQKIAIPSPIEPALTDSFSLALGHSDKAGQLTKILYE